MAPFSPEPLQVENGRLESPEGALSLPARSSQVKYCGEHEGSCVVPAPQACDEQVQMALFASMQHDWPAGGVPQSLRSPVALGQKAHWQLTPVFTQRTALHEQS
jgi:hypothetical protein